MSCDTGIVIIAKPDIKVNTLISGPIKFLISILNKSLRMVRHRYFGFSSAELAEGLTQIAVNDNNKKTVCRVWLLRICTGVHALQSGHFFVGCLRHMKPGFNLPLVDANAKASPSHLVRI